MVNLKSKTIGKIYDDLFSKSFRQVGRKLEITVNLLGFPLEMMDAQREALEKKLTKKFKEPVEGFRIDIRFIGPGSPGQEIFSCTISDGRKELWRTRKECTSLPAFVVYVGEKIEKKGWRHRSNTEEIAKREIRFFWKVVASGWLILIIIICILKWFHLL